MIKSSNVEFWCNLEYYVVYFYVLFYGYVWEGVLLICIYNDRIVCICMYDWEYIFWVSIIYVGINGYCCFVWENV